MVYIFQLSYFRQSIPCNQNNHNVIIFPFKYLYSIDIHHFPRVQSAKSCHFSFLGGFWQFPKIFKKGYLDLIDMTPKTNKLHMHQNQLLWHKGHSASISLSLVNLLFGSEDGVAVKRTEPSLVTLSVENMSPFSH